MGKFAPLGWLKKRYRYLLAVSSVGVVIGVLLTTQITTLFKNPNPIEVDNIKTLSQTTILHNPTDSPYYLIARIFDLFTAPLSALRLTAAMFGLFTALLLCYTLRQWFSDRIAVAGTLFVVTSSWFLAFSRIGAPFVMGAFWLSLFIAIGTWRTYTTKPLLTDSLIILAAGLSLYTPKYIWLAVIGVFVLAIRRRKQLYILPRKHQWLLPLILLVTSAPLIYAGIRNVSIIDNLLGIDSLPINFPEFLSRVFQNVSEIFFRGTISPSISLGRLPLLDIFSIVMVALGLYYFERRITLRRSQFLFAFGALAIFLVSMTEFDVGSLSIMFPIIMLIAIGGIVDILQRWLGSFPRNPVARSIGVCLLVAAIGFTSFYHLQRYFVAWGNNPAAIEAHKE
jgi:hypothetical protein